MQAALCILVFGIGAAYAEEKPEADPEGVAHADEDCTKMVCKDTLQGHVHYMPQKNPETGKCQLECGGYYTEGPCAGLKCPVAGLLAKEVPANEVRRLHARTSSRPGSESRVG